MRVLLAALLALTAAATSVPPSPTIEPSPEPGLSSELVAELGWEIVSRRPHDRTAFTQGLVLDAEGRLFESTGLWGESEVRELDADDGAVLRSRTLPEDHFGEGLALVGDELIQLTWRAGVARRFAVETFALARRHRYEGEGWGLCFDGRRLVMSDGSDRLTFRHADTFEELGSVAVTMAGAPLHRLNELECVADQVWANVWGTDTIVRIDPSGGEVTGSLDLAGIIDPHPAVDDPSAVLNGIAWDERAATFLVTGKLWPEVIEIRVSELGGSATPGR